MRALLVAMDRWVRQGTPPPASQHPRLSDGTLTRADALSFPAISGVQSPRTLTAKRDGTVTLPLLVPQVGADGNELSGVRTAEQAVPVATYTGWNFRSPAIGGPSQPANLMGSAIPFARTAAERTKANDPRPSLEERYPSKARYLALAKAQAETLVSGGYLRAEDVPQVMKRIEALWGSEN